MTLPVAQWLENPTGVRNVIGLLSVGDSYFSFVPLAREKLHIFYDVAYECATKRVQIVRGYVS